MKSVPPLPLMVIVAPVAASLAETVAVPDVRLAPNELPVSVPFLFFREALHNSVLHSKCRSIRIRTSLANQIFTLEISEDGCGIPAEKLASPLYLRCLKEERGIGWQRWKPFAPGQGTTHTLHFPLNCSNSTKPS